MKIKISTLTMAMLFVLMAFSQNNQEVMTREAPVELSAAFWDFETSFSDLLEGIETTSGDGFVIFDDPDRGNVLEMPGGQSAESSLVYGDAGGITGNTPRLLKFWVKTGKLDDDGDPVDPDNNNDVNNGVITNWGVNSNGERFTIRMSNANQMRVEVQGGFAQTIDDVIFPHQWHHVVIHVADVEDATTDDISIWVDGVLREVNTGTRVLDTQPHEFAFGWNSITGRTLFGYIDDFFVMNQSPVYDGEGDHILTLYSGSGDATDISGSGFYDEGEVVSLQATAPAGYTFTSWTYPDGTVASTDASFDFTMPDDNVVLVANFDVPLYDLTLEVDPEDAGTVTGAGSYPPFSEVTISATSELGYAFVNWTDEDGIEVSDQASFDYTMPEGDVALTANFEEIPLYTLNLEVNPENAGIASGGGQYPEGEVITVSVDPDVFESFAFENWTLNGNEESTEISFSFTMPGEDVTLVANFEAVVPQEFEYFVSDQWETEDGHFETIHAAVNHVKVNDDIVARSVVTIHVAEGVFEESANPVFNNISKPITLIIQGAGVNGAGQLATVVKSDLTERPPKGVGFGRRFAQLNNANNEGLELILKDLKFLYWGFGNTNGGGVVNAIANTEMKISIVNCEFDEVAARAGAIIQSLPGNKHEVLIDNILVQNSLAFDRAEKQGLLHFSGTSNLVIKNSTFMSNENDPLNFNNSEIDEGRKRGVAITLRNASDDPMQVLLENNVFVDNKVVDDPNVDDDNLQPVISVEFDGGAGETHLTMMENVMIGNLREDDSKAENNDVDFFFEDNPRLVMAESESNLLTKVASFDGDALENVTELNGFIINDEFIYNHPAIAFEMDGELPEVFYDDFGIGFLQYSGTGVLILELPEASAIAYGEPLSASVISGGQTAGEGTFTFDEPGFVPEAVGNYEVDITFTTSEGSYSESATISLEVERKELTVINAVAEDKVYDGNDQAIITGAELDGVLDGDDVVLENSTNGQFAQTDVGTDIIITTSMTLDGAAVSNYELLQPDYLTANITERSLTITADSFTKTEGVEYIFDGTEFSDEGLIESDEIASVTLESDGADVDAEPGEYPIIPSDAQGTGLHNYDIEYVNGTLTVTDLIILELEGLLAADKQYDGEVLATITEWGTLQGILDDDDVTLVTDSHTAEFDTRFVGEDKTVTVTGVELEGEDAFKYFIDHQTTTASILAKEIYITGSFTAQDKIFDGTTDAEFEENNLVLEGLETPDLEDVDLVNVTIAFEDEEVGEDKIVEIVSADIEGEFSDNYILSLENAPTATASVIMPSYTLTLNANPAEGGTVEGAGEYEEGTVVELSATPEEGYEFVNWVDASDAEISDEAIFDYTMPGDDVTLTANFDEIVMVYELTLEVLPEDAGTATGAGIYEEGESVHVSVLPEAGFSFVQWQDADDVVLSESPEFDFTMPAGDVTLTAVFSEMVSVTQAFWNFNDPVNGFTDILQQHAPTDIGEGFQLTDDAERGQVFEMPGGNQSEQAFVFGNSTGITGNQPRLIMFWMKQGKEGQEPDNVNDINNGVITSWGINDAGERFTVRASNQSQMRVEIQGNFAQTVDDVLELHTWHHVIIELDDVEDASTDQITIWVDGIERTTSTGNQDVIANTAESPFGFGFNHLPGRNLFGYLDNFLILDDAPGEDKIFGLEETTIADDLDIELDYPGMYYELTLLANPNQGGSVTGEGMQQHGSEVTVSAVPNEGYKFVNWTDGDQKEVSNEAEFTFIMPAADATLTAHFEEETPDTYTLTLEADPAEGGTVDGAGEYEEGTIINITASPADNYIFLNWVDVDGSEVSTDASFDFTMPAEDITLVAQFDLENFAQEPQEIIVNLFPNPTRELFTITAGSIINKVIITDITGKVVFSHEVNNTEVQIRKPFKSGIYIVRIYTQEGSTIEKLQIQK